MQTDETSNFIFRWYIGKDTSKSAIRAEKTVRFKQGTEKSMFEGNNIEYGKTDE